MIIKCLSPQEDVYNSLAADIVSGVMNGINGSVLAAGMTGAGKSYTIVGDARSFRSRGIAPRAVAQVFATIAAKPELSYSVGASYLEIYNERIIDLLGPERADYVGSVMGRAAARQLGSSGPAPPSSPERSKRKSNAAPSMGGTLTDDGKRGALRDYAIVEDPVTGEPFFLYCWRASNNMCHNRVCRHIGSRADDRSGCD
jgi:hypothetical protein